MWIRNTSIIETLIIVYISSSNFFYFLFSGAVDQVCATMSEFYGMVAYAVLSAVALATATARAVRRAAARRRGAIRSAPGHPATPSQVPALELAGQDLAQERRAPQTWQERGDGARGEEDLELGALGEVWGDVALRVLSQGRGGRGTNPFVM